jgi:hypothetical protein
MLTTSKVKWFGSILLASILIILALVGGKWGTDYSASASVNATPSIQYIVPEIVEIGSPDTFLYIYGSNFGTLADTRVILTEGDITHELTPTAVSSSQITVIIPADLLVAPTVYQVRVGIYVEGTIPSDMLSNPVTFGVWSPDTYLTIMHKFSR